MNPAWYKYPMNVRRFRGATISLFAPGYDQYPVEVQTLGCGRIGGAWRVGRHTSGSRRTAFTNVSMSKSNLHEKC